MVNDSRPVVATGSVTRGGLDEGLVDIVRVDDSGVVKYLVPTTKSTASGLYDR